jgi:hypothetical protein
MVLLITTQIFEWIFGTASKRCIVIRLAMDTSPLHSHLSPALVSVPCTRVSPLNARLYRSQVIQYQTDRSSRYTALPIRDLRLLGKAFRAKILH